MKVVLIGNKKEVEVLFKSFTFSGGERHIHVLNIDDVKSIESGELKITADLKDAESVIDVGLTINAVSHLTTVLHTTLQTNYLPYARQDRYCAEGDAFSLRVFISILKNLGVSELSVVDVHSPIAKALCDEFKIKFNEVTMASAISKQFPHLLINAVRAKNLLVSPDKGAISKVKECLDLINHKETDIAHFDKVRDPLTGNITGMKFNGLYHDLQIYDKITLVDDICDGGRTFIEASKILQEEYNIPKEKLQLYVTHGIFSRGIEALEESFSTVFVYSDHTKGKFPQIYEF